MVPMAHCLGTEVEGIHIPPFVVRSGDVMMLTWPRHHLGREEGSLMAALRGLDIIPGLELQCSAALRILILRIFLKCLLGSLVGMTREYLRNFKVWTSA